MAMRNQLGTVSSLIAHKVSDHSRNLIVLCTHISVTGNRNDGLWAVTGHRGRSTCDGTEVHIYKRGQKEPPNKTRRYTDLAT